MVCATNNEIANDFSLSMGDTVKHVRLNLIGVVIQIEFVCITHTFEDHKLILKNPNLINKSIDPCCLMPTGHLTMLVSTSEFKIRLQVHHKELMFLRHSQGLI